MRAFLLLGMFCIGCAAKEEPKVDITLSCKGIYYQRINGELKKFNQYEKDSQCWTDSLPLSQFETTKENWDKNKVKCSPVSFPAMTLVAANNYYDTRDGKAFLDLDPSQGTYRRIVTAEDKDGKPVITRLQGCFYSRIGTGVDSSFGQQLLLDGDVNKVVSTQYFDPMEIFQVTISGSNVNMVRFDDTTDYDYRNCPYLGSEWKFCEKLRDGNDMYFPVLSVADQNALRDEAIIISKQFNWTNTSKSQFDAMWEDQSRTEAVREDYKYDIIHIPDTPRFIDQAWRDYLMGTRPFMPDVNSITKINVCYEGSKNVTLSDGSAGKIYGEICYTNGIYSFVKN